MKSIYARLLGMALFFEGLSVGLFQKSLEDYSMSIPEPTIKQNFKHTKTFYQNSLVNQNNFYNKGIPRSGKNSRTKYVSIQVKARSRRNKIRKTLKGKI